MTTTATPAPAVTGARPTGSRPGRLIKSELLKIFTTNAWWIFAILVFATTAVALLLNIVIANEELRFADQMAGQGPPTYPPDQAPPPDQIERERADFARQTDIGRIVLNSTASVFTSGQFFGLLLMVIIGALVVTNEFHHQTATSTFLATPHRTAVIVAKLATAAIMALGFWAVVTAINIGVGSAYFGLSGYDVLLTDWTVVRAVLMNLLGYVVWAILGLGLGVLIRNQLGATITGGAMYLISFPVAITFFGLVRNFIIKHDWVYNGIVAVPGVASFLMISVEPITFSETATSPPWWVAALVLVGYAVLAGVVGTLITRKRDIS